MSRHHGRHRAPSRIELGRIELGAAGRILVRTALTLAGAGAPLMIAGPVAHAASDSTWDRVAQCESGGRWDINTGNGYHGGLQFSPRTWTGFGGGEFAPVAHQASRAEQIVVAERVLATQGWDAWPSCSRTVGVRGAAATQRSAPAEPAAAARPVRLSAPATTGEYVVQPGDTLSTIAATNDVAGGWTALVQKNPALAADPDTIFPGQHITL